MAKYFSYDYDFDVVVVVGKIAIRNALRVSTRRYTALAKLNSCAKYHFPNLLRKLLLKNRNYFSDF